MDFESISIQFLLFVHLVAFAIAFAEVLRTDWKLFRSQRFEMEKFRTSSANIKWLLLVLWTTGLSLILIRTGFDTGAVFDNSKLLTKLIVVSALTLNGLLLHFLAFPLLYGENEGPVGSVFLVTTLGAISTSSWIYAAFVGASRVVAPQMGLSMFLGLYVFALAAGVSVALKFVQPRVARLLAPTKQHFGLRAAEAQENEWPELLHQMEAAAHALGMAQNQIQAARSEILRDATAEMPASPIPRPADASSTDSSDEHIHSDHDMAWRRVVAG